MSNNNINGCCNCKHSNNIKKYRYCNLFDELVLFNQISCALYEDDGGLVK